MLTHETVMKLFADNCAKLNLAIMQSYSGRHPYLDITSIEGITERFGVDGEYGEYGELPTVLAQVMDNCIFAVKFNDDSVFIDENLPTSLNYVKIPIAFHLWANHDAAHIPENRFKHWSKFVTDKNDLTFYNADIVALDNEVDISAWFERLSAEIPHWLVQQKMCEDLTKRVNEKGKEYERLMAKNVYGTSRWNAAYIEYENLIRKEIQKIAKHDALLRERHNLK